jgi:hypothetical protein
MEKFAIDIQAMLKNQPECIRSNWLMGSTHCNLTGKAKTSQGVPDMSQTC